MASTIGVGMTRRGMAVVAAAITPTLAAIAGCGRSAQKTYDADVVLPCLINERGLPVLDDLNKFAPTSRNFKVAFGSAMSEAQMVNLSFAPTEEAAKSVEQTVTAAARHSVIRVVRDRNLVYYFDPTTPHASIDEIKSCLS
jgi:hypothetical protein